MITYCWVLALRLLSLAFKQALDQTLGYTSTPCSFVEHYSAINTCFYSHGKLIHSIRINKVLQPARCMYTSSSWHSSSISFWNCSLSRLIVHGEWGSPGWDKTGFFLISVWALAWFRGCRTLRGLFTVLLEMDTAHHVCVCFVVD